MKPKRYKMLEASISKSGETYGAIAKCLGIHETTLLKKRMGENDFTINEVRMLAKRLNMSPEEILETFELT